MRPTGSSVPVAVFASGGGTTLQALLDAERDQPWHVQMVVSDRASAGALERARAAGRDAVVTPVTGRPSPDVAQETLSHLSDRSIGIVLLAGYLTLVPEEVVDAFDGRMLNVHPALLPAFGGAGMYGDLVHRAVLKSGVRVSGATVHFVTRVYDEGRALAQWPVPVHTTDTVDDLRARVRRVERVIYPMTATHLAYAVRNNELPEPLSFVGQHFGMHDLPDDDPSLDTLIRQTLR